MEQELSEFHTPSGPNDSPASKTMGTDQQPLSTNAQLILSFREEKHKIGLQLNDAWHSERRKTTAAFTVCIFIGLAAVAISVFLCVHGAPYRQCELWEDRPEHDPAMVPGCQQHCCAVYQKMVTALMECNTDLTGDSFAECETVCPKPLVTNYASMGIALGVVWVVSLLLWVVSVAFCWRWIKTHRTTRTELKRKLVILEHATKQFEEHLIVATDVMPLYARLCAESIGDTEYEVINGDP